MQAWVTTTWEETTDPETGAVIARRPALPEVAGLGFGVSCESETAVLVMVVCRAPNLLARLRAVSGLRVHADNHATLRDEARRLRGVGDWKPNVYVREA